MAKTGSLYHSKAFRFEYNDLLHTAALSLSDFGFTETEIKSADLAVISVENKAVRYRIDGAADPTDAVGHKIDAGQEVEIHGWSNLMALKLIAVENTAHVTISLAKSVNQPYAYKITKTLASQTIEEGVARVLAVQYLNSANQGAIVFAKSEDTTIATVAALGANTFTLTAVAAGTTTIHLSIETAAGITDRVIFQVTVKAAGTFWSYDYDFSVADYDWDINPLNLVGEYVAGVGWRATNLTVYTAISIVKALAANTDVTMMEVFGYNYSLKADVPTDQLIVTTEDDAVLTPVSVPLAENADYDEIFNLNIVADSLQVDLINNPIKGFPGTITRIILQGNGASWDTAPTW